MVGVSSTDAPFDSNRLFKANPTTFENRWAKLLSQCVHEMTIRKLMCPHWTPNKMLG